MTQWRMIPSYPNYEASDAGEIRRRAGGRGARTGHVLSAQIQDRGYAYVHLWANGTRHACRRSRLVYAAWRGPIPEGYEVNHDNGERHDDAPHNLSLMTGSQNVLHAYQVLGREPATRGEACHRAKLTRDRVLEIRARYAGGGVTQAELGAWYGVTDSVVSRVVNRRAWAWVR